MPLENENEVSWLNSLPGDETLEPSEGPHKDTQEPPAHTQHTRYDDYQCRGNRGENGLATISEEEVDRHREEGDKEGCYYEHG